MNDRFSETTLSNSISEALRQSTALQHLVLESVAPKLSWTAGDLTIHSVQHSYTNSELDARESDVLVVFRSAEPRLHWVLIEVKINAPFGRNQPEDYVLRKAKALSVQCCDACATVVVAPDEYLKSHQRDVQKFDSSVSLESVREVAESGADLVEKLLTNHIDAAMRLFAVGYTPLQDKLREEQIAWYHAFVTGYKPHLVPNPTTAGKQVRDIFYPVPRQTRGYITHRLFAGEVSMGFMQRAHKLGNVERRLILAGRASVTGEVRGTSLYLVADSPVTPIDEDCGFAEQEAALQHGIDIVDELHHWALANRDLLAEVVEP